MYLLFIQIIQTQTPIELILYHMSESILLFNILMALNHILEMFFIMISLHKILYYLLISTSFNYLFILYLYVNRNLFN